MSRLKILLFLFVVTLAAAVIAGTYWTYTRVMGHDEVVETQIKKLEGKKSAPPDPGIKRFDKAIEILKSGDLKGAHEALYELLRHFPESSRAPEARRIVGEMNMDMLFSRDQNGQAKEYTVQPRDVLNAIAHKNQTSVVCLLRSNGMMSTMLQPGDKLVVFPLDFAIVVSMGAKTLTLLRNGRFFKEYPTLDIRLIPGMKIPSATGRLDLTVKDTAAWVSGKRTIPTDPLFNDADKWLMTNKEGFNVRALPQAKTANAEQTIIEPHKMSSSGKEPKNKASSKPPKPSKPVKQPPKAIPGGEDEVDATAKVPETGIFLAREDIEELFTLIRNGTPLTLVK
jgi:hypothetical protein